MLKGRLLVTPDEFERFARQIAGHDCRPLENVVSGMGYDPKDTRPQSVLARYIPTARALDCGHVKEGSFFPTSKLVELFRGPRQKQKVLRTAFLDDGALSPLWNNLRLRGRKIPLSQLEEAARSMWGGTRANADTIAQWLEQAGLLKKREGDILYLEDVADQLIPLDDIHREALRERLYVNLTSWGFDNSGQSTAGYSHSDLDKKLQEFRSCTEGKSEASMKDLTSRLFSVIGFTVQCSNGPRERSGSSANGEPTLDFSDQGDDLAAFCFCPFELSGQQYVGFALAAELKRKNASKKAVAQARGLKDRLEGFYDGRMLALPIVVADSERYTDGFAREAASSSAVPLISIGGLMQWVNEQRERFTNRSALIIPPQVFERIRSLQKSGTVEPALYELSFAEIVNAE